MCTKSTELGTNNEEGSPNAILEMKEDGCVLSLGRSKRAIRKEEAVLTSVQPKELK